MNTDTAPSTWKRTQLGEICDVVGGSTPTTSDPENWDGDIPWITPNDLSGYTSKYIGHGERFITRAGYDSTSTKLMPVGSVLYTSRAPIGYVAIATQPVCTNQGFKSFVPSDELTSDFLFWYLRFVTPAIQQMGSGTTFREISGKVAKTIPVAYPDTDEQRRIVEAIETHLSHLDAGVESLERAKRSLERMRLSLLHAAMGGRLMHQHATDQPLDLAGKIDAERVRPDPQSLSVVPESWTWLWLDELGELARGKSKHRPRNDPDLFGGKYPFIQTGEVASASTWIKSHGKTYSDVGLSQSRLWPRGTVCITIAANIAESALLFYPACFPDSVVGLIVDSGVVSARFAELFIRTAKSDLSAYAPATAQKNINLSILADVAVPVPPRPEQDRIVEEIDRQFSILDSIEASAEARSPERLRSALLDAAFTGRLAST